MGLTEKTFVITAAAQGPPGPQGVQGDTGPQGATGATGVQGPSGDVSVTTLGAIATKAVSALAPSGINYFDQSRVVAGALQSNGNLQALSGFQSSAFIPVGAATNIVLSIIAYGASSGYGLCFYKGDQSFLSCYSTANIAANTPIPVPSGASWVRFYMPVASSSSITPLVDITTVMLAYESLPGSYQAFGYINSTTLAANVATLTASINAVEAGALTVSSALSAATKPSVINLFDYTLATIGYLKPTGLQSPDTAFVTSGFVNVSGLSFITSNILIDYVANTAVAIFYDINKNIISTLSTQVAAGTPIPVPANAVWFRFWIAISSASTRPTWYTPSTVMLVNGSTLPGSYKAFGYVTADALMSFASMPLAGKNWVPVGDSITAKMTGLYQADVVAATGITIPSQDARGGRRTDQIFEMYQVAGSPTATGNPVNGLSTAGIINTTLPQAAGDGSVAVGAVQINAPGPWAAAGQTLAQVLANVDVVTIFLGTNDVPLLSNLGSISDTATATTYYGYLRAAIEGYLNAKPSIRLVWVIPYANSNLNATNYPIVITAIKAVCAAYAVPVVDLSMISNVNSITTPTVLQSDHIHPSTTGSHTVLAPAFKTAILAQL